LILALLVAPTFASGERGVAKHAPATTCLAVSSDDLAATCAAFQKTRLGAALAGPVFAPLRAALAKQDLGSLLRLRPLFGFDWSDLNEVHAPGGAIVFPLADGSLGSAWLFLTEQAPAPLAAASAYFKAQGYRETSSTRGGMTIITLTPPKVDKMQSDKPQATPRVIFQSATLHGIANSLAAVEALAGVAPGNSLATAQAYVAASVPDTSNVGDVTWFCQPFELWELLERSNKPQVASGKKDADDAEPKETALAAARRLGWSGVRSAAGQLRFAKNDPCEWTFDATLVVDQPYSGALRILELRPGALPTLPAWVGAGVTAVDRWRWDFNSAIQGFGNLYDQANEPGPDGAGLFEDLLDGLRDDPEGVQVDLRKDLFGQLAGDLMQITDHDGQGADPERWLYLATVRDAAKVRDALVRFYKNDDRVSRERIGEYDVWTVGDGASLFVEGESDSLVTVRGLALAKDQLLFGTDVTQLRAALKASVAGPALRDDPAWRRLVEWNAAARGEQTVLESLVRLDRRIGPAFEAAVTPPPPVDKTETDNEGAVAESLGARLFRWLLFGNAEPAADLPYASAPKLDAFRAALPRAGVNVSQTPSGWRVRMGALGPDAGN